MNKILKLSISNIWRNKILSLATIFVISIILFIFNIIISIQAITTQAIDTINEKVDISVYLKESINDTDIEKLQNDIAKIEGVKTVSYTSKEQAINDLKLSHPNLTLAFEKYNLSNPLPQSLNIVTLTPEDHTNILKILKNPKYDQYIENTSSDENNDGILNKVSENLNNLNKFINQVLLLIILAFLIGGTLIMINALQITIFSRKKEIEVMKIVGASNKNIFLPFIFEAIFYVLLALIFSFLMFYLLSNNINIKELSLFNIYSIKTIFYIFGLEALFTILIAILSSYLAVSDHL